MSDAGASFDGVIVGAGAAGLMAALRAADLGARVALLDPAGATASNLVASSGLFSAAGTRFQAAAGIVDGPGRWADDIVRKAGGAVDPAILGVVTGRSAEVAHFMADGLGFPVRVMPALEMPGHTAARLHEADAGGGGALAAMLMAAVRASPGITVIDAEARGLLSEGGRVLGVVTGDGAVRGASILLASGGFGANRALLARHAPEILHAVYIGHGPNDGRAHEWGAALGGELSMMDSYQGQGHTTVDGKGRLGPGLTSFGAIVVNDHGERFADESMGPSEFGAFVLAQPGGTAVEVFDDRIHEAAWELSTYRATFERGLVVQAADAGGIAAAFGLPAAALAATLDAYAASVAGAADPFGRTVALRGIVPPYRAARVTGALAHTQGGLLVDAAVRVRKAGATVPGLLAAGAAAAGISGHGAAGYLPGNGLGHAFATGFVAGETIAARRVLPHSSTGEIA